MGHADRKAISKKITNATTETQIFTAPWRIRRRYFIKKLIISNEQATNVAVVQFIDKDTASATPPVRGATNTAPLLEILAPAKGTITFEEAELPCEFFGSGMVAYSDFNNVVVMVEVEED